MLRRAYFLASCFLVFATIVQFSVAQDNNPPAPAKPSIEEIKVDNVPLIRDAARGSTADRILGENWVCITVKFSTSAPFTDEMTLKVYIDGIEDPAKPGSGFTVLNSQVTFINVPPSRDNYARFYISPTAALRYGGPQGRGFKKSNVFASIAIGGDEPVVKMMTEDKNPIWYQQGIAVNDVLLPFYDSPWWPFESNSYNQFKKR